jgi:epoxyqueuosine reductase
MREEFSAALSREALRLGFSRFGISDGSPSQHMAVYRDWVDRKLHGDMGYLAREDSVARRGDLRLTMEEVRSVVVVAQEYFQEDPPGVPDDPSRGVVARYARGVDYHHLLKARLQELLAWSRAEVLQKGLAQELRGFAYVDTGPILERELAGQAGLGWFGKNTMLIHPRLGSYSFLGVLLLDLELPPTAPFGEERCGSCQRCLDECPTGALLGRTAAGAPLMDARRCISFLTIENKDPIPRDLRKGLGNRIFGCDICQEVCPFSRRFSEVSGEPAYVASSWTDGPSLVELMTLSEEKFLSAFSGSPVKRSKRRGLLRNAAVALGNWGSPEAIPALSSALDDSEPLVRGHAAWALGELLSRVGIPGDGGHVVAEALLGRLEVEEDPWVREEVQAALLGDPRRTNRGS